MSAGPRAPIVLPQFTGPEFITVRSIRLALWQRAGTEPAIFFAHATGFHARCWDQIAARLPNRAFAVDIRGHGRSEKTAPPCHWPEFGKDTAALLEAAGIRGLIGVGHSMGAYALALAAARKPDAFSSLLLLDPVILPRAAYTGRASESHFARKRRNRWTGPTELYESYRERPPFRDWDPAVLRDYCDYGLLHAEDGNGFVLACPPEIEASIYEECTSAEADIYDQFPKVIAPVTLVRSARQLTTGVALDMGASPTAPDLATHFRRCRDVSTAYSHFIPMEAPEMVAAEIQNLIQKPV